jgi:hypothetical protein
MPKLKFDEYKADGNDERDESTIRAHKVTDETAGEYQTLTGPTMVKPGMVLIEGYRPDVYDVMPEKQLTELEYKRTGEESESPVQAVTEGGDTTDDDSGDSNTPSEVHQQTAGKNTAGNADNTSAKTTARKVAGAPRNR